MYSCSMYTTQYCYHILYSSDEDNESGGGIQQHLFKSSKSVEQPCHVFPTSQQVQPLRMSFSCFSEPTIDYNYSVYCVSLVTDILPTIFSHHACGCGPAQGQCGGQQCRIFFWYSSTRFISMTNCARQNLRPIRCLFSEILTLNFSHFFLLLVT